MSTVCDLNMCTGCAACINVCKKNAITIIDDLTSYNAEIDPQKCVSCGLCTKVCPNKNSAILQTPKSWKEGWANNPKIRAKSSSGGIASALMYSFIKAGGYVASCKFEKGSFVFRLSNNCEEIQQFSGSKYVKSFPGTIYSDINDILKTGNKVLFIGLPCQVAAIKNVIPKNEQLYTVDLICHGTPSPEILKKFLAERGIEENTLSDISFREKTAFRVTSSSRIISTPQQTDMYTQLFLDGVDYTENCYSCRYATLKRASDLTLGDSWGSEQTEHEQRNGVSLILCQTDKGQKLLDMSDLQLFDVNLQHAIRFNHQLESPSKLSKKRDAFFVGLSSGFHKTAKKMYPKLYRKNVVKYFLFKFGIFRN